MRDDLTGLGLDLTRLGSAIAYPPTPELAARVRARITRTRVTAPAKPGTWSLAGTALAAIVVLLAVIVGIAAPARDAVADLFDRIDIFTTDEVPENLPTDTRQEISLKEVEQRLGWRIPLPTSPDGSIMAPTKVLYQGFPPTRARAVALSFTTGGGVPYVILATDAGLGKGLGPGASAEPVPGLGAGEAYWLEGLRIVQIYDTDGNFIRESQRRTESNTLAWIQNDLVFRLEGDLSRNDALEIARSMK